MILGIGCDIVETKRVFNIKDPEAFANKILSASERKTYDSLTTPKKTSFLTGRFAAKEAFAKAMGCGIGEHLSWKDISVLNDENGAPYIILNSLKPDHQIYISIAHEREYAVAYCILTKKI